MVNTITYINGIGMKRAKRGTGDLVDTMIAPPMEKTKHLFAWVKVGERGQIVTAQGAREILVSGKGISFWCLVMGNAAEHL